MITNLTEYPQTNPEPALLTTEKRTMAPKTPHNSSEPFWKRNLAKTVKTKKIGEISRAKGGRH